MRNAVKVLVVLVSAALMTAATGWAAKPDRGPAQYPPDETFPAGFVCPFALTVELVVGRATETVHYDRNGEIRWIQGTGRTVIRVTNADDPGKSEVLNVSGPGRITPGDDGLLHVDGHGPSAIFFFPTDSPSSTALYSTGHLRFTIDPNTGVLELGSVSGSTQNICEMLA